MNFNSAFPQAITLSRNSYFNKTETKMLLNKYKKDTKNSMNAALAANTFDAVFSANQYRHILTNGSISCCRVSGE